MPPNTVSTDPASAKPAVDLGLPRLAPNPYLTEENQVNGIVLAEITDILRQVETAREYRRIVEDPEKLAAYRAVVAERIKANNGKPTGFVVPQKEPEKEPEPEKKQGAQPQQPDAPSTGGRVANFLGDQLFGSGATDREFIEVVGPPARLIYDNTIAPAVDYLGNQAAAALPEGFSEKFNALHREIPAYQKDPSDNTAEEDWADILEGRARHRALSFFRKLEEANPFTNRDMSASEVLQLLRTMSTKQFCQLVQSVQQLGTDQLPATSAQELQTALSRFVELSVKLSPEVYREAGRAVLESPSNLTDYQLAKRLDLIRPSFDPLQAAFAQLRAPAMLRPLDSALAAAEGLSRASVAKKAFRRALIDLYAQGADGSAVDVETVRGYCEGVKAEFFLKPMKAIETRMVVAMAGGFLTGLDGNSPQSEVQSRALGLELRRLVLTEPGDANNAVYKAFEWAVQKGAVRGRFEKPLEQLSLDEVEAQLAQIKVDDPAAIENSKKLAGGLAVDVQPYLKLLELYQNHPLNSFPPVDADLANLVRREGSQWVAAPAFDRLIEPFEKLKGDLLGVIRTDLKAGENDIGPLLDKFLESNRGRNLVNKAVVEQLRDWFKRVYAEAK